MIVYIFFVAEDSCAVKPSSPAVTLSSCYWQQLLLAAAAASISTLCTIWTRLLTDSITPRGLKCTPINHS